MGVVAAAFAIAMTWLYRRGSTGMPAGVTGPTSSTPP